MSSYPPIGVSYAIQYRNESPLGNVVWSVLANNITRYEEAKRQRQILADYCNRPIESVRVIRVITQEVTEGLPNRWNNVRLRELSGKIYQLAIRSEDFLRRSVGSPSRREKCRSHRAPRSGCQGSPQT